MNMTLDGLEHLLRLKYRRSTRNPSKVNIVRYADDFIITGVTREMLAEEVIPMVGQFLAERGLSMSPEKTRITHISDGFDFLGMNVRKYGGKLLIKPAPVSVQRFLRKVRGVIKGNAMVRHDTLIKKLNPMLRGWANYYRHVVALGKTSASPQGKWVDQEEVLPNHWIPALGLCHGNWQDTPNWSSRASGALQHWQYTDPAA